MKTLVIYSSKYGCAADCAEYLKTKLSGDITLIDAGKTTEKVELAQFGTIIIGGSVYVGKVSKKLRKFCEDNVDILTKKKVGIFLCCALSEQANEFLTANFPPDLLKNTVTTKVFGSEARLERMTFLDKMIIKVFTKGDYSKFKISYENMEEFALEIGQDGAYDNNSK